MVWELQEKENLALWAQVACTATALPEHMTRQALSIVASAYNQNIDKRWVCHMAWVAIPCTNCC